MRLRGTESGSGPPGGRRLPSLRRRSVRFRLTATYGALFFVCGALLLALASGVTVGRSSAHVAVSPQAPPSGSALARANARIQALQNQLINQAGPNGNAASLTHTLVIASLIALAVMTVAAVALGWIMSGRALRPVRTMTAAAQRISEHNLDERLAMTGPDDELKELGDTIDGLLERLEGAFRAQRRFVANASHELRTPLTTMRASLDVALAKPDPAPPQTVALAGRLRAELDRIDRLLEAFLVLARAQHRDLPGHTVLPLDYAVSAALADQAAAIDTLRLTVQHDGDPGGAWVAGSHALLSRMVENLIDNAVCHNQDGGWIRITAGTRDGRATLIVENGGPVLGQEQVSQLSQPFRRLGADRTGSDTGSGLGLSIVAAIAEAHGGTLSLHARDGGGLRVGIELPAAAATAIAGALA
jgi:signal transduction histidine kinase